MATLYDQDTDQEEPEDLGQVEGEHRGLYWDDRARRGRGAWVLTIARGHQTRHHTLNENLLPTQRDRAVQIARTIEWDWIEVPV